MNGLGQQVERQRARQERLLTTPVKWRGGSFLSGGHTTVTLTRAELQIVEAIWERETLSIREIHDALVHPSRPTYTAVQTRVYRLEAKGALRRIKRIGHANVFGAGVSRDAAYGQIIDAFIDLFNGPRGLLGLLVLSGRLTVRDLRRARRLAGRRCGR
jgi:predicted transcriptional regulator